ncbi:hypothetical protein K440DRAFT_395992 [Wilcoxina mikolae CBS 423.85]|nr:hypothetical protein K440DRAFT_395992 [Wilcoxina mikolae CBS 423.85]
MSLSENPNLISTGDGSTPYEQVVSTLDDAPPKDKEPGQLKNALPVHEERIRAEDNEAKAAHDESATERSLGGESTKAGAPSTGQVNIAGGIASESARKAQGYGTKETEMREDIGA